LGPGSPTERLDGEPIVKKQTLKSDPLTELGKTKNYSTADLHQACGKYPKKQLRPALADVKREIQQIKLEVERVVKQAVILEGVKAAFEAGLAERAR
jgi:hypothetical protein